MYILGIFPYDQNLLKMFHFYDYFLGSYAYMDVCAYMCVAAHVNGWLNIHVWGCVHECVSEFNLRCQPPFFEKGNLTDIEFAK